MTMVLNVIKSELTRLRRPRLLIIWFGLTAVFAVMINMVMFTTVLSGNAPAGGGPGVTFPDAATLASQTGLVVGLSAASSMFGVLTLSFWAFAVASDYSSGLIRLLASAQPRRWVLLAGKVMSLFLITAISAGVATVVNIMVAPVAAQGAGLTPNDWLTNPAATVLPAYLNLLAAMCVWGVIGLTLAYLFRSSAAAISIGIGYVLVFESVIRMASTTPPTWLLGTTLGALASGGTTQLNQTGAILLGLAYAATGIAVAVAVFTKRDVKE